MKRNALLVISIICLVLSSFNLQTEGRNISIKQDQIRDYTILALTPHASFVIDSDADFTTYSFPGTGIVTDPYVIEGYNITTTDAIGIHISDTTKYFVIRNCYIDAVDYGIALNYVDHSTATIVNNTCNNNYRGGIDLYYSGGSTIIDNTCNDDLWGGIKLYSSSNSIIINNTCNNNLAGVELMYSDGSTIANNTFSNDGYGIYLIYSGSSTVSNNTFTNCGLRIYEDTIDVLLSNTIENNWVNGKQLGFYTNLDFAIIEEPNYGQLILVNCTNVTVRDQVINSASIGLYLYYCIYSVIINNTFSNNSDSIILYFSTDSTIANNTCISWNSGVELQSSGNSIVTNNACNNGGYGIYSYLSDNSTVTNNTCNNNYRHGIFLSYSGSSTVADNTLSNNDETAINFYASGNTIITNNTCSTSDIGINIVSSDFCIVAYNLLQENEGYGVFLDTNSDNNLIHHNTFVDNNLGGTSQAYDDGTRNTWFDDVSQEGNTWSDLSGAVFYLIDGSAISVDLYPLEEPIIVEYPQIVPLALLLSIVILFLTRTISRKLKK